MVLGSGPCCAALSASPRAATSCFLSPKGHSRRDFLFLGLPSFLRVLSEGCLSVVHFALSWICSLRLGASRNHKGLLGRRAWALRMLVGRPFGAPGPNLTLLEVGAYTLEPSQLGLIEPAPQGPCSCFCSNRVWCGPRGCGHPAHVVP